METKPYLEEEERKRLLGAAMNIQDNLNAIIAELNRERPYKYYLEEKLYPIKHDVNFINAQITNEDN